MESTTEGSDMVATEIVERYVPAVEEAIRDCTATWERGETTSPDQRDYVNAAVRILDEFSPEYRAIGSTDEGLEFLADEIYEDSGQTYVTDEDLARHIVTVLLAE